MITIYPLKYIELQKYYNSLTFTLNELSLLLNVKGFYKGKKIDKNIAISKNRLYTSKTVLNNSLTLFYTFVRADLDEFTYTSSNITFNSMDPDKPEFLLYLDDDYNCVNNSMTILSNTYISSTATYSLTSFYSLSANVSNLSYTSLTSLYSLTAEYCKNAVVSPNGIDIFDIPYSRIFVSTTYPTNATEYDTYYNINTKKLYLFVANSWQEINWQKYVKSDRYYKEGSLRINTTTGALEAQSTKNNWFEIIPSFGANFTSMNYTNYIYYIAPGQTYVGYSTSIIPIYIRSTMELTIFCSYSYYSGTVFGLIPYGILSSSNNGTLYYMMNSNTGVKIGEISTTWFIPFAPHSNSSRINIYLNTFSSIQEGSGYANSNTNIMVINFKGYTDSTTADYFGMWCCDGKPIIVDIATIRREN
jgi:hypothetical protein